MTERTQRLLLVIAALLLTLGTGVALRRARLGGILGLTPAIAPFPTTQVAVRFHDVSVTGYEEGSPSWMITTKVIDTERDRQTMRFPQGLKVTLLDQGKPGAYLIAPTAAFTNQTQLEFTAGLETTLLQNGKPRATLSAPKASFDTKAQIFTASGAINVKVLPPSKPTPGELPLSLGNLTILCTQLRYEVGKKRVTCTGNVKITTEKGDEVYGQNLTLNMQTRDFSLEECTGQILAPKEETEIL
jgi:lipopolysaccharide assembly outer membrane protein LptD (OstA)